MGKEAPTLDFDKDVAKFTERQMEVCRVTDIQLQTKQGGKYILYGGCLGGGKLLRLTTPIATLSGWTTIGDIKVGDKVFDENGMPCNVVAISKPTKDKTYLMTFSDDSEIVAGASHEWITETNDDRVKQLRHSEEFRSNRRNKRPVRGKGKRPDLALLNKNRKYTYLTQPVSAIKTTQEIADTLKDGQQTNHAIPVCKPLHTPMIDLPIEPYVLGAWLGDGTSVNGNITGIDKQIFDWIEYYGYKVTQHKNKYSHCVIGLKQKLSKLNLLGNKHIPPIYLRCDSSDRLALLQGLMDTDGYCDTRGQCEIQITNKTLARDIHELICSLGIKVQIRTGIATLYGKNCGEKYRLKFITEEPVFRLTRKLERQKRTGFRGTHNRRYIVSVKEIEPEVMKCIQVDSPSHMYLCGESMIPTHNSYLLRWWGVRFLMWTFFVKKLTYVQVMLSCEDYPSLKDRQLTKIEREFPQWMGKSYSDHKVYGKCFILEPEFGSGVLCFRNLDDPSKYQSAEFAAILVDELTKNDYNTFNDLRMRLRWSGLTDEETFFIGGTNPGGIGHAYCKAFWIDKIYPDEYRTPTDFTKKFAFIKSKAEDNPYLDATYWQMLNTLPVHLRAAFRDGSWDTFVGQFFQEWTRQYHVIKPIPVPKDRPLFMTFDWGFGAPFSVGWWWIDDDGRFYRFAEWYGWNGTPNKGLRLADSEIAQGIIKREKSMGFDIEKDLVVNPQIIRICDPTCFNKKPDYKGGGQGTSTAEEFRRQGLNLIPGDASRALKWRQFHQRLLVEVEDGKLKQAPMMQIYDTCIHFTRTIPNLVVNPNNAEDLDTDGEDHCADEAALLCMARPLSLAGSNKWEEQLEKKHKKPKDISEIAHRELLDIRNSFEQNDFIMENLY